MAGAPSQDWSPRGLAGAGFLTLLWLHLVSLVAGCGCSMCRVDVPQCSRVCDQCPRCSLWPHLQTPAQQPLRGDQSAL